MQRGDGSQRVRDKNNIRKVKKRSARLTPSWDTNKAVTPTEYAEFDIEGDGWKQSAHNDDAKAPETTPPLFDITTNDMEHMESLLLAAASRADDESAGTSNTDVPTLPARQTRSQGAKLSWSKQMNSNKVIIAEHSNTP